MGINAASRGDTVLVDTGRYVENINFKGRNIVVGSLFLTTGDTSYISKTVIDGDSSGSVVSFWGEIDYLFTVLSGFTITNGSGYCWEDCSGGGILLNQSSPTLSYLIITHNYVNDSGGGIYCWLADPKIDNVKITHNIADYYGGGIWCFESNPTLLNVIINENISYERGGGIYCQESNMDLSNVTITNNIADATGGGIYCFDSAFLTILNSILWNNSTDEIYLSEFQQPNSITFAYSNVQKGAERIVTNDNGSIKWLEGNIDKDPLFVDPEIGDLNLQKSSPCVDAGTSFFVWEGDTLINLPETSFEGDAPDMGAIESPYSLAVEKDVIIPIQYALHQNYPNPFNPTTTIEFSIPQSGIVSLTVYNILGRQVETILNDYKDVGQHQMQWNASNIPSGVYFVRMHSGSFSQVRKVMVVR